LPVTVATHATSGETVQTKVSDAGIALDSYDHPSMSAPPLEMRTQEQLQQQLRHIARKLASVARKNSLESGSPRDETTFTDCRLRADGPHGIPARATAGLEERIARSATPRNDARLAAIGYQARDQAPRVAVSWLLSLLLLTGVFSLACGVGLMAHATMTGFDPTELEPTGFEPTGSGGLAWQGGLTITLVGEGLLIVGLTWMAIRLWRNGRRVNHQLQGVDRQLAELQYHVGARLDPRSSSSAAFYDHFAQGASSQVLLANLRGGLDQLAKRME